MNKGKLSGWNSAYSFTLVQTLKSKAYIISMIIMTLIMLLSMPLMNMLSSMATGDAEGVSPIERVYVLNDTGLKDVGFEAIHDIKGLEDIEIVYSTEKLEEISKKIEENESLSVAVSIHDNAGYYELSVLRSSSGKVGNKDSQCLGEAMKDILSKYKLEVLELTEAQEKMLYAEVDSKISYVTGAGEEIISEDTSISGGEYWLIYAVLFITMMVNIMASTQIASSIAADKSGKLVEYLLTSIKPLALIVGKILAMLTAVIIQMLVPGVGMLVSSFVTTLLVGKVDLSIANQYISTDAFNNISLLTVAGKLIIGILVILLGLIFFATLAGLAGAAVTKIEEVSDSLSLFIIVNLVGVYIGIGAAASLREAGANAFVTFALICPISSPFLLPSAIFLCDVSPITIALSIVVLVATILLLFKFVAKVYETLILHNGNLLKFKDIIKIAKENPNKSKKTLSQEGQK